jgi:hypothetical protein
MPEIPAWDDEEEGGSLMFGYISSAAGGFALAALIALWPTLRSRWQQRNDPPPLAKWAGGRMPKCSGMADCREPVGPSLPKATVPEPKPGDVLPMPRRGVA